MSFISQDLSPRSATGRKLGVWFVGALGDVATTAITGAQLIGRGLAPPTGMVTALEELRELPLCPLSELVFGGHDIREGDFAHSARRLDRELKCFGPERLEAALPALEEDSKHLRPGVACGVSAQLAGLRPDLPSASTPRAAIATLRADLEAFRAESGAERVVVVHVTSTEPVLTAPIDLSSWAALEARLDERGLAIPASILYAIAAFEASCPFINFTPCLGSSPPALEELALTLGLCHAGRDGKTGETLVRTVLAPMFLARNLRVLSWSGFNVLGNRDGAVLADPGANAAKTSGKDAVLRSILGGHLDDSLTRIDYVPSLKDWKTAWDLIHFEGFLGTQMTLQFTWQGADSALAAPLVLDLVRLIDAAQCAGRRGVVAELACFFKNPMGWDENAFAAQVTRFQALVAELRGRLAEAPR